MNKLSTAMLAALSFFASNVTGQTQSKAPLKVTINALWKRDLLAVNADGIIIPNQEGFNVLGKPTATPAITNEPLTVGQMSDELWEQVKPDFFAKIKEGEQQADDSTHLSSQEKGNREIAHRRATETVLIQNSCGHIVKYPKIGRFGVTICRITEDNRICLSCFYQQHPHKRLQS